MADAVEDPEPEVENQILDIMYPFAGEGAFQKSAWEVGKVYVVRLHPVRGLAAP